MPSLNTGNAILSNPIKVDSSYNVGIGGAASGSFKLQVTGTTNLTDNLTMTIASGTKSIGFGGNTIAAAANALIYSDTNYLVLNSKAGSPLYLNFDNANASSTINMFNGKFILTQPGAATFTGNVTQNINDGTIGLYKADGTTPKAFLGNPDGSNTDEGYLELYKTSVSKVKIRANGNSYFNGGNVGIGTGTNSPSQILSVDYPFAKTDTTQRYIADFRSNNASNPFALTIGAIGAATLASRTFTMQTADNNLANGGNISLQPYGGNVLIGTTTNASSKLRVSAATDWSGEFVNNHAAGQQLFTLFTYGSTGLGSIQGNGSNVSYFTSSDYRLKDDLKEINALDKILSLKVYDFRWKSTGQRMDGFIAHELQEVIPYAVSGEKDGEQMQNVDYSKLTPVNTKAIQELYLLVQEQQAQIEAQQQQINSLINR